MFAQGDSPYRKERLIQELKQLADSAAGKISVPDAPVTPSTVTIGKVTLPESRVPEAKDPYRAEWLPRYMEMNNLRARLRDVQDIVERGVMAHKILKLEKDCMSYWVKRDYFHSTGQLVPVAEEAEPVTDVNQLQKKLGNARSNLSKAKAILKEDPENGRALERFEKYSQMIEQIEKLMAK